MPCGMKTWLRLRWERFESTSVARACVRFFHVLIRCSRFAAGPRERMKWMRFTSYMIVSQVCMRCLVGMRGRSLGVRASCTNITTGVHHTSYPHTTAAVRSVLTVLATLHTRAPQETRESVLRED